MTDVKTPPELRKFVCPHCDKEIVRIEWRLFIEGQVYVVGCGNCFKVLGTSVTAPARIV